MSTQRGVRTVGSNVDKNGQGRRGVDCVRTSTFVVWLPTYELILLIQDANIRYLNTNAPYRHDCHALPSSDWVACPVTVV